MGVTSSMGVASSEIWEASKGPRGKSSSEILCEASPSHADLSSVHLPPLAFFQNVLSNSSLLNLCMNMLFKQLTSEPLCVHVFKQLTSEPLCETEIEGIHDGPPLCFYKPLTQIVTPLCDRVTTALQV